MSDDFVKDIDDLKEVLGVVTDKVPGLLRELRNAFYSRDAAENMADAVVTFYTKLVEAGIDKAEAMEMAKGYMINLKDILGGRGGLNVNVGDKREGRDD